MASGIKAIAHDVGFDACGFAQAHAVDEKVVSAYEQWLARGKNACMHWAGNYLDLRFDPQQLFPGTKTVISLAMNYLPEKLLPHDTPQFARYAYGKDYHEIVRNRAYSVANFIQDNTGCACRVCVDSAPMLERYWAQRAGLGFVGLNKMLIIPHRGSYFFLCEILTTLELPPDEPCTLDCGLCHACERHCPGGALHDGELDARRCLSCQTIENHDEALPASIRQVMGNHIYGCDECQLCCPHNRGAVATRIQEFQPSEEFLNLTLDSIQSMTRSEFNRIFRHSPVKRTKLAGLQRNATHLKDKRKK